MLHSVVLRVNSCAHCCTQFCCTQCLLHAVFTAQSFPARSCFCRQPCFESIRLNAALQRFTARSLVHTFLMHTGLMHSILLRYCTIAVQLHYYSDYTSAILHDCHSTATLLHYCHVLSHTLAALRHYCYTTSTLRVNSHKKHIILLH